MAVIDEVDEKIKIYREKIAHALELREEVESLTKTISQTEEMIKCECAEFNALKKEEVITIRIGDLLEEISELTDININELETKITVVNGIYTKNVKDIPNNLIKGNIPFVSYLNIHDKAGKKILCEEVSIFDNLEEIEADGENLLSHCTLEKGCGARKVLVINKDVENIICHFKLEALDFENYKDNYLLPRALRNCLEYETKEKGRQYTR